MVRRLPLGILICLLFVLFATSAPSQVKIPTLYFLPNSSPTIGSPTTFPFQMDPTVKLLNWADPHYLPRIPCHLVGIRLIAAETGQIDVGSFTVVVGNARFGSTRPDPEFENNLVNRKVVLKRALNITVKKGQQINLPFTSHFWYLGGRLPLCYMFILNNVKSGVKLLAASTHVKVIYSRGPGSLYAKRAQVLSLGGLKTGFDFATGAPTVSCHSAPMPGTNLALSFNASSNIGDAYTAGCAFTSEPGIDIGEYTIPLTADALFYSVWMLPGTFLNFGGHVGVGGFGSGAVAIPDDPTLIGVSFVIAFVTYNASGLTNVSLEHWVTIGMG